MNRNPLFMTTRWTVVLDAAGKATPDGRAALAELCRIYWFPLYAYIRRRGYGPHDAEDLTQGFFARLLRLGSLSSLATAERGNGRFRAFLLASLRNYLADERDWATAGKRDVGCTVSLDLELAEHRYHAEASGERSPEQFYERQWALTLLGEVLERLQEEYRRTGREAWFEALRFAISGERSAVPYAALAERLAVSGEAIRVAVHRLRQRYRRLLKEAIAQTLEEGEDEEEELRALRRILSQP